MPGDTNWKGKRSGKGCSHGRGRSATEGWRQWLSWSISGQQLGLLGMHWPCSPTFSPQSSQPSTTSPFKQEVFAYSPSLSSENPSLGATATPIIMSRSPTGKEHVKICMM